MFKEELKLVPNKPGCYLMYDEFDVIYVGKAKDLKKRVASYFNKAQSGKTMKLVNNIKRFEYIITNSEVESYLLEINLIKKYKPKYNILLKDDKSYPYIEITNEKYPRIKIVRTNKKTKSKLFGPYPNVSAARDTVNLINRLYPIRKCRVLPKKPCLYYHIDQCLGYCINDIPKKTIDEMIKEIIKFLKGDATLIKERLKEELQHFSKKHEYEKCIELNNMLNSINLTLDKQEIEINDLVDRDIIGYYEKDGYISIQIFFLRRGTLIERKSEIFEILEEKEHEVLRFLIMFYNEKVLPKEILIPEELDDKALTKAINSKIVIPKRGIKKKLLNLAYENAKLVLNNKLELIKNKEEQLNKALDELKEKLKIKDLSRIEIFDNSHLFGSYSVSGMVVFEDGKPDKKQYRKYKIKSNFKDDYHYMKEVIYRRYFKVLKEGLKRPDLIIVDGGKQQLNAAREVLNNLNMNIKVIGLKKDKNHKTSKLLDNEEIEIKERSPLFYFLTRMQDEVHRFTINYHKKIRSKGLLESDLEKISGLGEKRLSKLFEKYDSYNNLQEAKKEELEEVLPKKVAKDLFDYFKSNK